jgi:spore coat protein A
MNGETADHHYQFKRETFRTTSDGEHPAFERRGGAAPMFWYHDHAMGATRFNNYAGLAGAWIVRDEIEELIGLPTDESYEVPLILQDRNLDTSDGGRHSALNGKLLHKVQAGIRECFGPATLVSGKLWPRMSVDPCVYRLRILNGSNARYFRLNFFGVVSKDDRPPYTQLSAEMVQQIGTDGGLLAEAIDLPANGLVVAPAERADVLIDFGLIAEKYSHVILLNDAPAPYGNDPPPAAHPEQEDLENLRPVPHVMRFDLRWDKPICGLNNAPIQRMALDPDFEPIPSDHHELPHHEHSLIVLREEDEILRNSDGIPVDRNGNPAFDANGQPIKDADGNPVQVATRTMLFLHEMLPEQEASRAGMNMYESVDEFGTRRGIRLALNESNSSTVYVTASKRFDDATNIVIEKGAWHLWKILNLSPDSHPFHIHLTQLQAIQHRSFRPTSGLPIKADSADFSLTEISLPHPINPPGWKDTFRISPGERGDSNEIKTAEMMVLFGQFFQHAGRYMYHCHILEHEDSDMMRPFVVAPSGLMGLMGHMGMSH